MLRNIVLYQLKEMPKGLIDRFPTKFNERSGDGHRNTTDIINQEISENDFDDNELEAKIFHHLVFNSPDYSFVRHINKKENSNSQIKAMFQESIAFNRKVNKPISSRENLISIRIEGNKIIFLFRFDTVEINEEKQATVLVPCILDLDRNIFLVRIKNRYLRRSKEKPNSVIGKTTGEVKKIGNEIVDIVPVNAENIQEGLYNLFDDDSYEAEKGIKETIEDEKQQQLEKNIKDFITENLDAEFQEQYLERILSIYYQEIASSFSASKFGNRYVFALGFLDKQDIQSSARNINRHPIYSKEIYWNLKDIIHKHKSLEDLSIFWQFNPSNFGSRPTDEQKDFVEVNLKVINKSLRIHYYDTSEEKRGFKEEYVLRQLERYLFQ